jgi:hypothetical protein
VPGRSNGEELTPGTFQIISTIPNPTYAVDPNIKQPRVVDYNLAYEQALGADFRLQVTGIYRQNQQFISSVNTQARWAPTTVTNDFNGQPLGVYNWINQDTSGNGFLITNPNGFQYLDANGNVIATANANRDYKGLQFVLSKRMTNRWQAQISYVLSKASGTVDSAGASSYGQGRQFETPTLSVVNADGESSTSRRHEVKAYLSYQIPKVEVGVNAFYRYLSGDTYTPFERYSSDEIDFPHRVGREPFVAMPGSFRMDPLSQLDVRFEKIFRINVHDRIGVYADVTNLFNVGTVDQVNTRVPSQAVSYIDQTGAIQNVNLGFGAPLEVIPPRQVTLGARWSF